MGSRNQENIACVGARKITKETPEQHALGQGCIHGPESVGATSGPSRYLWFLSEVCEVRKVEGTFSAFQSMEVRMLVAEEVKAAFSRPSLSCAQH